MKSLIAAVVCCAALFATSVPAAEMYVPDSFQEMSDEEGMDVRGMGYYSFGRAFATVSGFVSVTAPGVYIYERKFAQHSGTRRARAIGGFTVQITQKIGCLTQQLTVSEVGFARAGF